MSFRNCLQQLRVIGMGLVLMVEFIWKIPIEFDIRESDKSAALKSI